MKRLGLVGVGPWGRRYMETIARRQDCRIVVFARGSDRSDDGVPGATRSPSWANVLQLASDGGLDGVVVATNPENQAEIAEAAISAGVPILVEKPLGLSAFVARRILAHFRALTRKPPVVVNYIHLWSPAYRTLKAMVRELPRGIAEIASVETEGFNRGPFRGWSSLHDYGPHDIAMCLDLLETRAAIRLRASYKTVTAGEPAGELFNVSFDLAGVTGRMCVGNGASRKARRFAVALTDGRRLVYDDTRPHPFKLLDDDAPVPIAETGPLDCVLDEFLRQVDDSVGANPSLEMSARYLDLSVAVAEALAVIGEAPLRSNKRS